MILNSSIPQCDARSQAQLRRESRWSCKGGVFSLAGTQQEFDRLKKRGLWHMEGILLWLTEILNTQQWRNQSYRQQVLRSRKFGAPKLWASKSTVSTGGNTPVRLQRTTQIAWGIAKSPIAWRSCRCLRFSHSWSFGQRDRSGTFTHEVFILAIARTYSVQSARSVISEKIAEWIRVWLGQFWDTWQWRAAFRVRGSAGCSLCIL